MSSNSDNGKYYASEVIVFESKKKKNPNEKTDPKELEGEIKGMKMKISFDGERLIYNKKVLMVEDMIAVASAQPNEIIIHSLPRTKPNSRDRYWKQSKLVFNSRDQAKDWFTIVNTAIENGRFDVATERGPIVEFAGTERYKRVRVILNPHGGKGDSQHVFNTHVLPLFQLAGIQSDVEITTYDAHARDLAITHEPEKYEGVLLVSGDGLVSEFVNGLMARVDSCYAVYSTPICHIPAGTQNQIAGGIGTSNYYTAAYCIIKHKVKALDLLRLEPRDQPAQYSLCGVVAGIGGDMVQDYETYRRFGSLRYPLLKLKWGVVKRQKHVTDITYTPLSSRIAQYQCHPCHLKKANCPVCADGHRNYFYKPLRCPNACNKQEIHPEDSDYDSDAEDAGPGMLSSSCSCEYPRWCRILSNRDYVYGEYFEITAEEDTCRCCPKGEIAPSLEYPERVSVESKEITQTNMQYLTIGVVVNAPYDGEYCHCCDGSLDLIIARTGNFWETMGLIGRYLSRTHLESPLMDYVKVKRVHLHHPGENTVNVDGEKLTYDSDIDLEVCEAGITCFGELYYGLLRKHDKKTILPPIQEKEEGSASKQA